MALYILWTFCIWKESKWANTDWNKQANQIRKHIHVFHGIPPTLLIPKIYPERIAEIKKLENIFTHCGNKCYEWHNTHLIKLFAAHFIINHYFKLTHWFSERKIAEQGLSPLFLLNQVQETSWCNELWNRLWSVRISSHLTLIQVCNFVQRYEHRLYVFLP